MNNTLHTTKKASQSYNFSYDFVLVCVHQYFPAAAIMPEALL